LSVNGLGLTVEGTLMELDRLKHLFQVLPELPIHEEWQGLVIRYRVSGKNVHDARLVAAMVVHGVEQILTFNGPDFARHTEISVLNPFQIS
jgi:predicted nucleic acid-binding protein